MTRRETRALPVRGRHLCGLTWLDGLLWYSDGTLDRIFGVDPGTGAVEAELVCRGVRTGLTAADGGRCLLQVVGGDKRLRALDPRTGEVIAERPNPRPGGELCGVHETAEGLWTGYNRPQVIELRRRADGETLVSVPVDEDVADLTVMGDRVVFANHVDGRLNVLDPPAGRIVEAVPVSGNPTGLAWDGQRLWYCDYPTSHLRAVDMTPAGDEVAA
ncbi:MAG TPA: hypothetical protein VGW75_10925 [Solirubrobacteraceae bacterium]|jgi:sugar lactone lactonase YvrE|nr:hypothetical protein [Solirubrobacteraceae bacterium]